MLTHRQTDTQTQKQRDMHYQFCTYIHGHISADDISIATYAYTEAIIMRTHVICMIYVINICNQRAELH